MSHHLSGPDLKSPSEDARLDLCDVFVFTVDNGARTVLITNHNPDFGGQADFYHPDAVYRLDIDTNGDSKADIAFSYVFSEPKDGAQTVTVYRADGALAQEQGAVGEVIIANQPVNLGYGSTDLKMVETGPYRFFAGRRSDPFFADLEGIGADFKWTGRDTMIDMNIYSLVLEVPSSELGSDPKIGVWARVSLNKDGQLVSMDRGAHSSVTAYFNETNEAKDAYNRGEPATDWETYLEPWTKVLAHTGHYNAADAEKALRVILPDVLRFDRSQPASYPNGRKPTDDVESIRILMVSGGEITTGGVPPHTDLLDTFPYLGHPHPKKSA